MAGTENNRLLTAKDILRAALFHAPLLNSLDPNNPFFSKLFELLYNRFSWMRGFLTKNKLVDPNSANVINDPSYSDPNKRNYDEDRPYGINGIASFEKLVVQNFFSSLSTSITSFFSNPGESLKSAWAGMQGWWHRQMDKGRHLADRVGTFFTKTVPQFFTTTLPRMASNAWHNYAKPVVDYFAAQLHKWGLLPNPANRPAVQKSAISIPAAPAPAGIQMLNPLRQPRKSFAAIRTSQAQQTIRTANLAPAAPQPGVRRVESVQAARAEIRPPEPRPGGRRPLNNILAARGTTPVPAAVAPKAVAPVVQIATAHPVPQTRRQPHMALG